MGKCRGPPTGPPLQENNMNIVGLIVVLIAVLLAAYLFYALIHPERF